MIADSHISEHSVIQVVLGNALSIFSNTNAFAVVKADGSVVTWGDERAGGDSRDVQDQLVNVQHIYSTGSAFAAVKADGSVVTWGR